MDLYNLMKDVIPNDHCRQVNSRDMVQALAATGLQPKTVLDLGCGVGSSIDLFKEYFPDTEWTGVDIEESPEVANRTRSDGKFVTYNGRDLPFPDASFDLVYSHQVLEHVRFPDQVLSEVARVMLPGGVFVGQTSQFEPYHSYSIWNFTIYGFKQLIEDAGLKLEEMRPSIDGFTLMERTYSGRDPRFSQFFTEESPRNREIERLAQDSGKGPRIVNHRKLNFCGQFCFRVKKP